MRKVGLLVGLLLSFCFVSVPVVFGDSFSGWTYHKTLTFSSGFSGLQVNFNVTYAGLNGNCQVDFEDLRFRDKSSYVTLDAWNETTSNSDYVEVWLELGAGLVVDMFYGNDVVGDVWDSSAVFERVIDSGVVLALPMDEGSGTNCTDYSGNGNHGAVSGAGWVSDGRSNVGLLADGVDDSVTVANSSSLDVVNMTVSFWLRRNASVGTVTQDVMIRDWNGGFYPLLVQLAKVSGKLTFGFYNGAYRTVTSNGVVVDDTLTHVVCTFSKPDAHIYFDGVDDGLQDLNFDVSVNDAPLRLCDASASGNKYGGFIGEVFVFDSVVSGVDDLFNFYPQCLGGHLGSLFLREWNGGVMPTVVFGVEEGGVVSYNVGLLSGDDAFVLSVLLSMAFVFLLAVMVYVGRR